MNDSFSVILDTDSVGSSTGGVQPGTVTVRVTGEIDMLALPELQRCLGAGVGASSSAAGRGPR